MAYTAPITFVNGVPLTAAQLNAMQDNIRETAVAKATTAGRYFAVAGPNQLVERAVTRDTVDVIADTSSTSYTATLSGPSSGPVINSTCGERMIVGIHSYCRNLSGTGSAHASYAISGATTVAASDRVAVAVIASALGQISRISSSASAASIRTSLPSGHG